MRIHYEPYLTAIARKLRKNSTLSEVLLWDELKNGKMYGYDFHRQKPILKYIVDFYCPQLKLIIEIDGEYHQHEEQYKLDKRREKELEHLGLNILRFDDLEVKKEIDNVIREIEKYIDDFQNTSPTLLDRRE